MTTVFFLLGLVLASWSLAQQAAPDDDLNVRLESLDPRIPLSYFELAEDFADRASQQEHAEMAKKLFGSMYMVREDIGTKGTISKVSGDPNSISLKSY